MARRVLIGFLISAVGLFIVQVPGLAASEGSSGKSAVAPAEAIVAQPQHGPKVRPTIGAPPAAPRDTTSPMTYHGSLVLTAPTLYISYWGPEWAAGFTTCDGANCYTSAQLQTYVNSMAAGWGGSGWKNIDTQYCQNVAVGTQDCTTDPAADYITNPPVQFGGAWNDPMVVPATPSQNDIFNASIRLLQQFNPGFPTTYDRNGVYMVFTPPGKSQPGAGTVWCAYHSAGFFTVDQSFAFSWAYQPYTFERAGCGMNFVNPVDDAFGHGYYDGLSITIGHEFIESETDPDVGGFLGLAGGWFDDVDRGAGENGDKCAWNPLSGNVTFGANFYAMQPDWSNANAGCVMSWP
jgi:serine protease